MKKFEINVDELTCKQQFDKLNELIIEIKKEFLLPKKEQEIL